MSVKGDQVAFIRQTEWRQLVSEVAAGHAIIAFVPSLAEGEDREASKMAMYERFWSIAPKEWGLEMLTLDGHEPTDAFAARDVKGRLSMWVERRYSSPRYKEAYIQFWKQHGGLPDLFWIDGTKYNVDHSFNGARILNDLNVVGDAPVTPDESLGYIRLFLLSAEVNQAYGRGPEKELSSRNKTIGGFKVASWLVLLKLMQYEPVPKTMQDVLQAANVLTTAYGSAPFRSMHDMAAAIAHSLGISKLEGLVIAPDGKIDAVGYTEAIDRGAASIEVSETEFAWVISAVTGWPVMEASDSPTTSFWIGVQTPCGSLYGLAGIADLESVAKARGVAGAYIIRPSGEQQTAEFDGSGNFGGPSSAWRMVLCRDDQVCRLVRRKLMSAFDAEV